MDTNELLDRFHRVLVEEIRAKRPDFVRAPFTVAEIYQDLVPYRTHRDRLGVEMNGDYEHVLLRLLSGEGDFLVLESDVARRELRSELKSQNPNTGIFRDFAAADVRLNAERMPEGPPTEPDSPQEDTVPVESLAPSGDDEAERPPPLGGSPGSGAEPPSPPAGAGWSSPAGGAESSSPPAGAGPPSHPGGADATSRLGGADATSRPGGPGSPSPASGEEDAAACRWCREALPRREQLNYCPFCGTDVHVVPCPSCGEELEPTWRFCISCGAGVAQD